MTAKKFIFICSFNPYDTAFEDLQVLKNKIGKARFVLLGERDHLDGNSIEAKIRILKFLHQKMDFDMIAFESGFYDLNQANKDIKQGKSVKLALAKSIFPIWTSAAEFQPFIKYIEKNRDLPILGFDSQFTGEYLYENFANDIQVLLKKEVSQTEFEAWFDVVEFMGSEYTFPKNNDFKTFQKQYLHIQNSVKNSLTKQNKAKIDFTLQVLGNVIHFAKDYYFKNTGSKSKEEWRAKDSNIRDSLMAENLIFLAKKYPNKKIICWAATAHFANKVENLNHEELQEFIPMGKHIKKEFGEENVYILGFTGLTKDSTQSKSMMTIEQEFANTALKYGFWDLKSLPKGSKFNSTCMSAQGETPLFGEWSKVLDGLFFVGNMTVSTPYSLYLTGLDEKKQAQKSVKTIKKILLHIKTKLPKTRQYTKSSKQKRLIYSFFRGKYKKKAIKKAFLTSILALLGHLSERLPISMVISF